jgi:hypothetical protein
MARPWRVESNGYFPLASGMKLSIVYPPEDEVITPRLPATAEYLCYIKTALHFGSISLIAARFVVADGLMMRK